jgi:hypothetical protein
MLGAEAVADQFVPKYVEGVGRNAGMIRYWMGPFPVVEMFDPDTVAELLGTERESERERDRQRECVCV